MRGLVAAYLAAYPAEDFGPHAIGRVLGRSIGAVANALDRLTALGQAQLTSEALRRYAMPTRRPPQADPGTRAAGLGHRARACRPLVPARAIRLAGPRMDLWLTIVGPTGGASSRSSRVGGHLNLPAGGHEEDPMAITERDRIR